MPKISLKNVSKSYSKGGLKAVNDLNLEVADGDFMCLLGPSGCGKTTTLRMIAGLENLSSGELAIDDTILDARNKGVFVPPEQREMGLVFQSYALWPHLKIEENIDFGLRLRKVTKVEREERVTKIMKILGIDSFRNRYPSQLSGGQQQRVALARMLVVSPKILLLDEPLSNLDARLRLEMRTELKRIHKEFRTTIVFVTHDQWEAMTLATRIAVMNDGKVQQVGSPDEIYGRPSNQFVAEFVGNPPINILDFSRNNDLLDFVETFLQRNEPYYRDVCYIVLRPETIRLTKNEADLLEEDLHAPVKIHSIMPTGGNWIIELKAGGFKLHATTNEPPQWEIDEPLFFHVEAALIQMFDERSERIDQIENLAQ